MNNRTELICYIYRDGQEEEYKVSLSDADYTATDFADLFVEPIMLAQKYHPDNIKEVLNKEEYNVETFAHEKNLEELLETVHCYLVQARKITALEDKTEIYEKIDVALEEIEDCFDLIYSEKE